MFLKSSSGQQQIKKAKSTVEGRGKGRAGCNFAVSSAVPETNLEQLKAGMEALTNMKLKSTGGGVGVKLTIKNK